MAIAVYAGSFDPITNGHSDIIERTAPFWEKLIVAPGINAKKQHLFTIEERVKLAEEVCQGPKEGQTLQLRTRPRNVEVRPFTGLLVDFCRGVGATVIIRGLRATADFEQEMAIAHANRQLCPDIDTFFLPTLPQHSFVSSSTVKEIAINGGDVGYYVHPSVARALKEKFRGS